MSGGFSLSMLLHCPTCRSPIDASLLPPGTMASCPHCHGLFQVPPAVTHLPEVEAGPRIEPLAAPPLEDPPGGLGGTLAWAVLFVCLVAVIGGGSGYLAFRFVQAREQGPAPAAVTPEPAFNPDTVKAWREVGHWSNLGQMRTSPFRTTNSRWRIHWTANPVEPDNPDNFAIIVTDRSGKQLQTPVSIVGAGDDTAYVSIKPGVYVVEVFTINTRWTLTVEEPE